MSDSATLLAGAAAVVVTPEPGCYLAGFPTARIATGIHDPLWARALVLQAGRQRVALVAVDCIGLLRPVVAALASRCELRPGQLLVCSTHTHSGPDTIGLWGPSPNLSGLDPGVLARLCDGVVAAVAAATAALRPALFSFARCNPPQRTAVNLRDPESLDADLAILQVGDAETGRGIATLVNWGCHPETLQRGNTLLSSDFAHPLRERLESGLGGTALFVNGALGAMVTVSSAGETFDEADRIGTELADAVYGALRASEEMIETGSIAVATREVRLPVANDRWAAAVEGGVLERTIEGGEIATEVTAWGLGPATLLSVPGEAQPALGRRWKRMMGRHHRFLLGLANDEIGYILRRDDFGEERYAYERSMSLGPETGTLLTEAVQRVLAAIEG